jgi:hypothetical protein
MDNGIGSFPVIELNLIDGNHGGPLAAPGLGLLPDNRDSTKDRRGRRWLTT